MKTKEEVLLHLKEKGYAPNSAEKIMGFLLGSKIIERGEKVKFANGCSTFNDFWNWFNKEKEDVSEELRGIVVTINRDGLRFPIVCLSDYVNGKVLGFNGRVIKVFELPLENIEYANEQEIESIYSKMTDKGFGYLDEVGGFFLIEELDIVECDEEDCECKCPHCALNKKED